MNELVCMQISFALFKEQPEMIWHRAEDSYWNLLEETRRAELIQHLGYSVVDVETGHITDKEKNMLLAFLSLPRK